MSATLTLTVASAPVLNLGHGASILSLSTTGTRVLSQDVIGHWVLWNQSTHGQVTAGNNCPGTCPYPDTALPVQLARATAVIGTPAGFDIRAASDGHLVSSIAQALVWWNLSTDGSYVAGATMTTLQVWSATTGQLLFSRNGNYSAAAPSLPPGQLLVALGPAGANVVETIMVPSGNSSVGPAFQGSFLHWFFDGGRFLTEDTNANRIYVYSATSVQQDALIISGSLSTDVFGQGDSIYTFGTDTSTSGTLTTYTVGASTSPSATFAIAGSLNFILPSGLMMGLIASNSSGEVMSVFDFSTAAPPTRTDYTVLTGTSTFAGLSGSQWVSGNNTGEVLDGTQASTQGYFDYGELASVVGSATVFAVATRTGKIFYFDATTNAQLGSIDQLTTELALSADGTLLFALVPAAVNVYSLPSGTLRNSVTAPANASFIISPSANVVALSDGTQITAYPSRGGAALWSVPYAPFAALSPDGTMLADSPLALTQSFGETASVMFYNNGTSVTSRIGTFIGWLDNNRAIVDTYDDNKEPKFTGAVVYDSTGALISNPTIPAFNAFQVVSPLQTSPDLIYSPELNTIYSLTSGAATWSSASPGGRTFVTIERPPTTAAIAGPEVVFESTNYLLGEPH